MGTSIITGTLRDTTKQITQVSSDDTKQLAPRSMTFGWGQSHTLVTFIHFLYYHCYYFPFFLFLSFTNWATRPVPFILETTCLIREGDRPARPSFDSSDRDLLRYVMSTCSLALFLLSSKVSVYARLR